MSPSLKKYITAEYPTADSNTQAVGSNIFLLQQ